MCVVGRVSDPHQASPNVERRGGRKREGGRGSKCVEKGRRKCWRLNKKRLKCTAVTYPYNDKCQQFILCKSQAKIIVDMLWKTKAFLPNSVFSISCLLATHRADDFWSGQVACKKVRKVEKR